MLKDLKMEQNKLSNDSDLFKMPRDAPKAIKFIVDVLINYIYPLIRKISYTLHDCTTSGAVLEENVVQIRYVYTLCSDQVKKCIITLIDIIKLENHHTIYLQESRNCVLERLSWCYKKLLSIEELLNKPDDIDLDNPIFASTMYFVNWIDQTFDLLNKLSDIVYKTNIKEKEELYSHWKNELVENVCVLHTSIDELLLCAITLCKYCLPVDQPIVRARCQVVMRETKALLGDLIDGDLNTVKATTETLKLPIKPSNINVLIDVLKDVLYVLETNTNTALLALVVHCFSQNISPADKLKEHFERRSKETCSCCDNGADEAESCQFIKEFDLHNERLLQIGSFAMSCSSDQKRLLSVCGGAAVLEALEPQLVPALRTDPRSHHAAVLSHVWHREVDAVRHGVFLIVDPAAFTDKVKRMMHRELLEMTKDDSYDINRSRTVIDMGCVLCEFFLSYEECEPDALRDKRLLTPLLRDLNKVQIECKIVSNLLCEAEDYKYKVPKSEKRTVSFEKMLKRLKLLYTLVKKINNILNPSENDEFDDEPDIKNITQTINVINGNTYVSSPRKINNITRSIFARTDLRSSTGRFPLAMLTKHLKSRNNDLSFSIKLDEICNISEININNRETSILYHSPLKTRSSLRKAVLNKHCVNTIDKDIKCHELKSTISEKSFIEDTSLQITDVLNQINDLTCNLTKAGRTFDSTVILENTNNTFGQGDMKRVRSVSVSSVSDVTGPSDVDTLDRINDLDLLESRLSDLRSGQIETSL